MKPTPSTLLIACCMLVLVNANAAEVYGGAGFPGLTLGYSQPINDSISLRGEYSGGLNLSRSGARNGIDFNGNLKANAIGVFGDYYPMAGSGFRGTGGVTFNDIKARLDSTGNNGTATINNKPVNLNGLFYNVELKYPSVTPYLGVGYQTKRSGNPGWGFFVDAGVMIGKFETTTRQNIVGTQGIVQADVDAQTNKVRESVNKLSVLPKLTLGAIYSF